MVKGCPIGKKTTALLRSKGCPKNITEILNRFIKQIQKEPSDEVMICMGRMNCTQPSVLQLVCPHKLPPYHACSKCILLIPDETKCGCVDEKLLLIASASKPDQQNSTVMMEDSSQMEVEVIELDDGVVVKKEAIMNNADDHLEGSATENSGLERPLNFEFRWVRDGKCKRGYLVDQFQSKYKFTKIQKGGGLLYRCCQTVAPDEQEMCTAVALRKINKDNKTLTISLKAPHIHPLEERKLDVMNDSGILTVQ